MNAYRTLDLFRDLAAELTEALKELADWGETGERNQEANTQYTHDVVADELIVPRLLAEGFSVVSEETGRHGDGEIVVVVDPIDGSTNAARGLPWYATSMCAVDREGASVGYVANLSTGEEYTAVRDDGAEASTGALSPSGCSDLGKALISFSGLPPEHGGWSQFRVYGAAALDLCAVASGRFDGFVDPMKAHAPWDYLAAMLICREAGASVVDLGGESLESIDPAVRRGPVAASTPELLDQLLVMASGWN